MFQHSLAVTSTFTFIHIGKCGGTSLVETLLKVAPSTKILHLNRPTLTDSTTKYVTFIRHPIKRLVSAFDHTKALVNFNVENIDVSALTTENSPCPWRLEYKKENGFAFSEQFDAAISVFESANHLGEALSSSNTRERELANYTLTTPMEHIYHDIGWYLYNGNFLSSNPGQLLFVGSIELLESSLKDLAKTIEIDNLPSKIPHRRSSRENFSRELSAKAINNLKRYKLQSDYAALFNLYLNKKISEEVLQSCLDDTSF